jgi:hypothetical protein
MLLKRITLTPIPAITKINKTQARKLLKSGKYRDLFMPFILPNVKLNRRASTKRTTPSNINGNYAIDSEPVSGRMQRLVRFVFEFLEIGPHAKI